MTKKRLTKNQQIASKLESQLQKVLMKQDVTAEQFFLYKDKKITKSYLSNLASLVAEQTTVWKNYHAYPELLQKETDELISSVIEETANESLEIITNFIDILGSGQNANISAYLIDTLNNEITKYGAVEVAKRINSNHDLIVEAQKAVEKYTLEEVSGSTFTVAHILTDGNLGASELMKIGVLSQTDEEISREEYGEFVRRRKYERRKAKRK